MDYIWDRKKARENEKKHGIDFADAIGVFEDEWGLTLKEQIVSGEQRYLTMGTDFLGGLTVVVFSYRDDNIRIISARKATKRERKTYEKKRA